MGCQGNEVKCQQANHLNIFSSQLKNSHQLFCASQLPISLFLSPPAMFLFLFPSGM